jgi:uncharacterized protein
VDQTTTPQAELQWHPGLLPDPIDLDTAPFWAAAAQRRLTYQTCDNCGAVVFFPRRHCPECLGRYLTWHDSSGQGTIYTFSVVRASRDPRFIDRVPYCVALIDLDEGFRLMSSVVDTDVNAIAIGQRVQLGWARSGDALLPVFRPEPA